MQHQFGGNAADNLECGGKAACNSEVRNCCAADNIEFICQAAGCFNLRNFRQNTCGNSGSTRSRVVARAIGIVVVVSMVVIAVVVVSSQS
jgi:hypothetical protein